LFASYDRDFHPGVSVAVLHDGKIVHQGSYGFANLAQELPISDSTVFHIGSETKQFVAFSIASLIDEGKLSKEDDIRHYLPEVPFFGDTIRIKHLLSHTSGIREFYDDLTAIAGWEKGIDPVVAIQTQKALNFQPGSQYSYCNTEYGLLKEIVERITRESFSEWIETEVFIPLGMNHTIYCNDERIIIPNYAIGILLNKDGDYVQNTYIPDGIISTATDLTKWVANYESPVVGNPKVIEIMGLSDTLNNGETLSYTFGQEKIIKEGVTWWGHGGGFEGYRSYILRCPYHHFGVVVLSNFDYFNNWFMARKVAQIYLGTDLTENEANAEAASPVTLAPEELETFCGTYWFNYDLDIRVTRSDSCLVAQITGQPALNIWPYDDNRFHYKVVDASIAFQAKGCDTINQLIVYQNNENYTATAQRPEQATPENMMKYTGKYYSEELETIYTIELMDENFLQAIHPRTGKITLRHIFGGAFASDTWFFNHVEFIRENKEITGFYLSTGRVKKLTFRKM